MNRLSVVDDEPTSVTTGQHVNASAPRLDGCYPLIQVELRLARCRHSRIEVPFVHLVCSTEPAGGQVAHGL